MDAGQARVTLGCALFEEAVMRPEREHPAAPEQVEHGFDEGRGRRPRPSDQRRVGRFSDGIEARTQEELRRRRFSEGVEQFPESPENAVERRFSQGYERSGDRDR
jgi:hypothetical protein